MTGRRWLPPTLWAVVVLTLSSLPGSSLPPVDRGDTVAHLVMYAVLGWLTTRAVSRPRTSWPAFLCVLLALALFGAVDEWHQRFVPGRFPDFSDWVADVIGSTLGAATFRFGAARRRLAA